jgi:hypothetical protein
VAERDHIFISTAPLLEQSVLACCWRNYSSRMLKLDGHKIFI